ncbi:thiol reductant ABC exporter subunit CydD [Marinobacter sp. C2H3]|uniref:thiol reductant ABC exporter subunit CydD n=1 Tax=Marinobacter sp. C2H3 TaxID=3119003 RepID=UPI00300F0453
MPAPEPRAVRRWLSELAQGQRRWIQGAALAGTLSGVAAIVQMVLIGLIAHRGLVQDAPPNALIPLFLGLTVAVIARSACQGLQTQLAARASERVKRSVRRRLHQHWRQAGPRAVGDESAAVLSREWIDHVDALHGYFARFLPQMILATLVPLMILAVVFWLDWLAGIFLVLSAPLIPLFMALVGMGAERLNQQHFETISRLSGQFLDKVRGLTTLQLFGQTEAAARLIEQRSERYRAVTLKTLRVAFLSSAVLEFFASVAIAVIAIYIGFGLLGYIEFGPAPGLTLFSGLTVLLLAPEFFQPLRVLSQHYHDRAAALGAGAELMLRMDELDQRAVTPAQSHSGARSQTPSSDPSPGGSATGEADDAPGIALQGVWFAHPGAEPLFRSLTLSFRRGEAVALTGPSGGGKSTLLQLLAGFVAPSRGQISVLGRAPGSFRFGWLGQRGFLVHGTWADNLRLTTPEASDVAIESALERVGLAELVHGRPDGIHSAVTDDGRGLSGGQARRLSLARLFLADYDLILLDEPTAGLDADSEIIVIDALHKLCDAGKTLVFATHQQALLTLADRILSIDRGEVQDA